MCFFSSNNIWNPQTKEAFERLFVNSDYYEWNKFTKINVRKVIFVRDIYKSWYVNGINININCVDKVLELIKQESNLMDLITVGSSAGGYMPAFSQTDCVQYDKIKSIKNIKVIKINSKRHGIPIFKSNLLTLLLMDTNELNNLSSKYDGKIISAFNISIYIDGVIKSLNGVLDELKRVIKNKIKK